jgi:hypothetical protein
MEGGEPQFSARGGALDETVQLRSIRTRRTLFVGAAFALLCFYYLLEISDAGTALGRASPPLNFTFNSMLDHLLRGHFDVDPRAVGYEGFSREGRVYAYWGIFPALLRLPLVVSSRWLQIDITLWSCWIAACTAAAIKLHTLRIVGRAAPDVPAWLLGYTAIALALSGAQICFLRPLLYQEVCLWAGAFAALFVFAGVRGVLREFANGHDLEIMALAFGGCLLTRVSIAIGLLAALLAVMLVILSRRRLSGSALAQVRILRPLIIASCFVGIAAFVNFQRFGNIATFADYSIYNYNKLFPDRVARTAAYGLFNIVRLPFGMIYYFFPVWVIQGSNHQLLLGAMRDRLIDAAELPPGSFLLSDPLLLVLGLSGVTAMLKRRLVAFGARALVTAIAGGLVIPAVLMLTAISMCFRYRLDFYPLFEFLAFVGVTTYGAAGAIPRWASRRALLLLLFVSIVASHLEMALYRLGDLGPAQHFVASAGVVRYYTNLIS